VGPPVRRRGAPPEPGAAASPEAGEAWRAAAEFETDGSLLDARPHTVGHIHRSFLLRCSGRRGEARYLLQRINTEVFGDPGALMGNISVVTEHLRRRSANVPRIVPTRSGHLLFWDPSGAVWRCYEHLDGCKTLQVARQPGEAAEAGRAFGRFERLLADLDPFSLAETLPGFHDPPRRLRQLADALDEDPAGRSGGVGPELEAVRRHSELAEVARGLNHSLPRRVVHYDCKISNVLFDTSSGAAMSVVDLDTVMPGVVLWDFGDLVRSIACEAPEDERDLERVRARADVVGAAGRGYLEEACAFITERERAALPLAGAAATFEQAVRFLADHVGGDTYFRTAYPGHNLDRARSQLALLDSLVAQGEELGELLDAAWAGLRRVK
jgi:Ser/Thr protein kinase RdoA (MazF antagonist)